MKTIKEFILREIYSDYYISGEKLAESLGVSRNAIWKAINSLKNDGFVIESITSKGYRLSPFNNKMSAELIKHDGDIIILKEVDSTNNYAKKLAAEGAKNNTVVIAEAQSSGKGRLGRNFVSPEGKGVYMSIIIRPDFAIEFAPLITSAAAVATALAIETLCSEKVGIKWVNDLYMNGKKVCGILTEASLGLEANVIDYAVVGIGINVHEHNFGEIDNIVTSIDEETGDFIDRNRLCEAVLRSFNNVIGGIESKAHLKEYKKREILTGNMITANVGAEKICGKALGVDDNANLIVETEKGVINLSSGEANRVRSCEN